MSNYTVNTYTSDWHLRTGIDFDLTVGVSGFYSDQDTKFDDLEWNNKTVKKSTIIKLDKSDGVELAVLNLLETCKTLKLPDTTEVTITKDVSNRYTKYDVECRGKMVSIVANMTGVFVDGKRCRNVLSAFK